jgi:hypothetical protein
VDHYVRLEQGRSLQFSESVLDAVARALRLNEVERDHLYRLGRNLLEGLIVLNDLFQQGVAVRSGTASPRANTPNAASSWIWRSHSPKTGAATSPARPATAWNRRHDADARADDPASSTTTSAARSSHVMPKANRCARSPAGSASAWP